MLYQNVENEKQFSFFRFVSSLSVSFLPAATKQSNYSSKLRLVVKLSYCKSSNQLLPQPGYSPKLSNNLYLYTKRRNYK